MCQTLSIVEAIPTSEGPAGRATEDYAKAIFSLAQDSGDGGVPVRAIAMRLGVTQGSASAMVKRLAARGLVAHERYGAVRLTDEGRLIALAVLRRHRLIETFLAAELGMGWDRVHHEAEVIEHVLSDDVLELIAAKLGHPTHDPHGDPIPSADLVMSDDRTTTLWETQAGTRATLAGVSDADPEMLRYLADRGIRPGTAVEVISREPFDGPVLIRVGRRRHSIGRGLALAMRLDAGPGDG